MKIIYTYKIHSTAKELFTNNTFEWFTRPQPSHEASYENIDNIHPEELELHTLGSMLMETHSTDADPERIPLDARQRRPSMKRLVRQASTVNTQKSDDGTIKLTYWFWFKFKYITQEFFAI